MQPASLRPDGSASIEKAKSPVALGAWNLTASDLTHGFVLAWNHTPGFYGREGGKEREQRAVGGMVELTASIVDTTSEQPGVGDSIVFNQAS
jgi:hypothetical protein